MPVSSSQTIRFQVIDRCLSDRMHKYTFEDILERVNDVLTEYGKGVKVRQLRKDFADLQSIYGANIETYPPKTRKPYYRYSDPDFQLYTNQLSDEEMGQLRETLKIFGRFRGVEKNAWLENVVSHLELKFGVKANPEHLVDFEDYQMTNGMQYLSEIIDATIAHFPLGIYYHPYGKAVSDVEIYPYYVKQFNGRWFLFGWDPEHKHLQNMALDRIEGVRMYGYQFDKEVKIDFKSYFSDIIGVSRPRKRMEDGTYQEVSCEHIVMRFSPKRFPYAKSKPMHHSFKILSEENCTASVDVLPNNEFFSRVLEFGPDVEILSPDNVREQIKEKISNMYKSYFAMQHECTDDE